MDIPLCLERLTTQGRILPTDDWGPCANTSNTYADFAAHWRGVSAVPTSQEMDTAWSAIVAAGGVAAIQVTADRTAAKSLYDALAADPRVLRAIVTATVSELNTLRGDFVSLSALQAAIAAAPNTLAGMKAAIAGLTPLSARTAAQVRTAIRSGIDADA